MQIRVALHVLDEDPLFSAEPPAACLPSPRTDDDIIHEEGRVRLDRIHYHYQADQVEIGLFA